MTERGRGHGGKFTGCMGGDVGVMGLGAEDRDLISTEPGVGLVDLDLGPGAVVLRVAACVVGVAACAVGVA